MFRRISRRTIPSDSCCVPLQQVEWCKRPRQSCVFWQLQSTMRFSEILRGVELQSRSGNAEITGIQYDSRKIKPGDLFLAMRGESTDGNRYIDSAIKQGA